MQRELKRNARMSVKRHYYRNVLVVFICSLLLVGGFNYTTKNIRNIDVHDKKVSQIINNKTLTSSEVIDELIEKTSLSKKMQIDIAKNLIRIGLDNNKISESTGLSIKEIESLKEV